MSDKTPSAAHRAPFPPLRPLAQSHRPIDVAEGWRASFEKFADNQVDQSTRLDVVSERLASIDEHQHEIHADMAIGFAASYRRMDALMLVIGVDPARVDEVAQAAASAAPTMPPPPLPPMRRREDSVAQINLIADQAAAKAQQLVDDPHKDLTPQAVRELITQAFEDKHEADRVAALQAQADEAKRVRDQAAADAKVKADKDDADRRQKRVLVWAGIVVGIFGMISTALVTYVTVRASDHGPAPSPAIVYVPAPPATSAAPSSSPATSSSPPTSPPHR